MEKTMRMNPSGHNGLAEPKAGSPDCHLSAKCYEIRIQGRLDSSWSDWFEGMEVKQINDEEMILFGPVVDQAALIGIVMKINRLNLNLRSINEI